MNPNTSYIPYLIQTASVLIGLAGLLIAVFGRWSKKRNERLEAIEKEIAKIPIILLRIEALDIRTSEERQIIREKLEKIMDMFLKK